MSVLEKIKNRTNIDVEMLKTRLIKELGVDEKQEDAVNQVEYSLYDTLVLILDVIHQPKVPEGLYTTWLRMTKDYWYLNGYNKLFENSAGGESNSDTNAKVKKLQVGDTTTEFADTSSQVEINGVTYSTGTIEYSEDALIEKYKKDLYRHRKLRWSYGL